MNKFMIYLIYINKLHPIYIISTENQLFLSTLILYLQFVATGL